MQGREPSVAADLPPISIGDARTDSAAACQLRDAEWSERPSAQSDITEQIREVDLTPRPLPSREIRRDDEFQIRTARSAQNIMAMAAPRPRDSGRARVRAQVNLRQIRLRPARFRRRAGKGQR